MACLSNLLVFTFTFCMLIAVKVDGAGTRKIKTVIYPDCEKFKSCIDRRDQNTSYPNGSFPNLVYVQAIKDTDILHYVMTTVEVPSVLLIHTTGSKDSMLNFDWDRLLLANNETDIAGAINATGGGEVKYTSVAVFSRLIEYNDAGDTADLTKINQTDSSLWNIIDFNEFHWMNITMGQEGKSVVFNTSYPQPEPGKNTSGSLSFEFEILGGNGRDKDLPRLIYTENNTQLNFALDGYVPMFNASRFALEVSMVAEFAKSKMTVEKTKSIDDEFSPGVFEVVNWYTDGSKGKNSGYLQWKPICYVKPKRARDAGTEVRDYSLVDPGTVVGLDSLIGQSLARAFYGKNLNDTKQVSLTSNNISFGLTKDGYYNKHNYTVWTVSLGYGQPPVEGISSTVLIIIAAGLGIPVLIILFGGVYVCIKKRKRSSYEKISGGIN